MSLRDEQRALTRGKVLAAVLDLVAAGSLDGLSVPAVARRSGVSVATIYRYFPTRDDLLTAAAAEPSRQALERRPAARRAGDDDLMAFQRVMWHEFATNLPLLRHQLASSAGRDMRSERSARSREELADYLSGLGVDPVAETGQRLIALLMLVSGSVALIELHDRQGLAVDEAIDHSFWALRVLLDATRHEQQATGHARRATSRRPTSRATKSSTGGTLSTPRKRP